MYYICVHTIYYTIAKDYLREKKIIKRTRATMLIITLNWIVFIFHFKNETFHLKRIF